MTLLAPFPYFGGKRSAPVAGVACPHASHELAVKPVLFGRVACRNSLSIVACFAFRLAPINVALVRIERCSLVRHAASAAQFLRCAVEMTELVFRIFRGRVPSKIFDTVVGWGRVGVMAGVMLRRRRRPDEGEQHQPLHLASHDPASHIEADGTIAIPPHIGVQFSRRPDPTSASVVPAFSLQRPNRAVAGGEIIREPWDWAQFTSHSRTIHTPTSAVKVAQ